MYAWKFYLILDETLHPGPYGSMDAILKQMFGMFKAMFKKVKLHLM